MSRILLSLVTFGIVALAVARPSHDKSRAEFTGRPWLGRWISTGRTENAQAAVEAIAFPNQYAVLQRMEHTFRKEGDHFLHEISIPDRDFTRIDEFRMGEDTEILHDGHPVKLNYKEEGDALVIDVSFRTKGKHIRHTFEAQGDELIKTSRFGNVSSKRWFRREIPN